MEPLFFSGLALSCVFPLRVYLGWPAFYWSTVPLLIRFVLLFCVLVPVANADVVFPIIVVFEPLAILYFLPVVLIEYIIMKKHIELTKKWKIFLAATASNAVSTICGIPFAWGVLFAIQSLSELSLDKIGLASLKGNLCRQMFGLSVLLLSLGVYLFSYLVPAFSLVCFFHRI
jgi:hypothetical protein